MSTVKAIRKGAFTKLFTLLNQVAVALKSNVVIDILHLTLEFLETWLHQILYQSAVYPAEVFQRLKKFEVPVFIATHPGVKSYISDFVQSCYSLFEQGQVSAISVTVFDLYDMRPLEKYIFQVHSILLDQQSSMESTSIPDILESESICTTADLQQYLRSILVRTLTYESIAKSTKEKTYSVSVETVKGGYPSSKISTDEVMDWVPADQTDHQWKQIVPLKTVQMDLYRANTFVKVASKKGKEKSLR